MIHILTTEPFPNGFAASNRILCYAKGLVYNQADCEVVIINRTEKNVVNNKHSKGVFENVKYRYIPNTTQRSDSFLRRRIDDFVDMVKFLLYCTFDLKKGDKCIFYFQGLFLRFFLLILFKIKDVKSIRELCEYPCSTKKSGVVKNFLVWFDLNINFKLFDGFIAISESLMKIATRYKSSKACVVKIPILIDDDKLENTYLDTVYDKAITPYIFHAGTITEKKDGIISTLKAYVKAMKIIEEKVDFYIAGQKSRDQILINELIRSNYLEDHVKLLGVISQKEVDHYQSGSFLSILNKNDNEQNRYGFSTKLATVLLYGTPVITTTVGEANFYLKDGFSAYIVEPNRPDLIAEKIIQSINNPEERIEIGLQGRKIALQNFSNHLQAKKIIEFLKEI